MQISIGENGAEVTLPLSQYEKLVRYKYLAENSVCIPAGEYERLMRIEDEYLAIKHRMNGLEK